jgi:opacity protein-like surface antigen
MEHNYLFQFMKRRKSVLVKYACILMFLFSTCLSMGQTMMPGEEDEKDWHFVVAPYLWFSGLNGQLGVATIGTNIDAGFSDVFSNLDFAFMLYGEARYKKFGLAVDLNTVKMNLDGTRPILGGEVKIDQNMTFLETTFLYSIVHTEKWSADVHAGIRTWWMNTRLDAERIISPENRIVESQISFLDPIIGAKVFYLPHKKWPINVRGDIGGFGAGSEFSWQVLAGAGFKFSKSWTVLLQYRLLGVDYTNGTEGTLDYFRYNTTMSGPLLGVMATF